MKILYATSEATPFCKTGGLADVAGSLPTALAAQGAEVAVVLPLYHTVQQRYAKELEFVCYDYVDFGWRHPYCGLFRMKRDGVTWYFLDNQQYFNRTTLYGHLDDGERFGFFSRAVVQMLSHLEFWPDVIHCNDWQTALIPIYLEDCGVRESALRSIRTVLSIHNIEYQGQYDHKILGDLFGLPDGWVEDGTLVMDGCLNLLKGAILCADAVNAVSPTYARELKLSYFAHGLESILTTYDHKLRGILNGIDLVRYNPETDPLIAGNFSKEDLTGKATCKLALQEMMGLPQNALTPVVGLVSRLVSHKGLDLMCEKLEEMMALPMQLVVLGKGDQKYEEFFRWAQSQYPGRIAVRLDYNESLSSAIYAGSDLYVMPSKSEPCGLSQMIAMRYGTVAVVRETGGLKDSVQPYNVEMHSGNGFTFVNYDGDELLYALRCAVYLYKDFPDEFNGLRQRAMDTDFSWNNSAKAYLEMYGEIADNIFEKSVASGVESVVELHTEGSLPVEDAEIATKLIDEPVAAPIEEPVTVVESPKKHIASKKSQKDKSHGKKAASRKKKAESTPPVALASTEKKTTTQRIDETADKK